ncbi:unnamed protein product [Hymenolepis diminuta]|uniref:EGF-like domain-containing protein n=1 Tax=Hymenolepis diminuta TaxID=6216 RepID=A0A564ZB84_HYMDI|nr:unnamed protein product [Hymenolepis diminuta]
MGANTSKDEIFRNEIGCDTIGTVPCNDSTTLFCLEGECALYVADFEKKCVEGCKCYAGYFGEYCQFREVSLFATAGIVGAIIGVFLLILFVTVIICCWRRLNREWEQEYNNPSGAVNSRTAGNQRNEVENSTDRPRSGYYEHEFFQNPNNNGNRSLYPNPDFSISGLYSHPTTLR